VKRKPKVTPQLCGKKTSYVQITICDINTAWTSPLNIEEVIRVVKSCSITFLSDSEVPRLKLGLHCL